MDTTTAVGATTAATASTPATVTAPLPLLHCRRRLLPTTAYCANAPLLRCVLAYPPTCLAFDTTYLTVPYYTSYIQLAAH